MTEIQIGDHMIGLGRPTYVIAELSANHGNDFDLTVRTIQAMKAAGADAVKVQTYTADTMTLASDTPPFVVRGGTLWDGRTLHELYQEASMPWEWQPRLKQISNELGMGFFSTPFDATAVDFLESMDVPAHKIASFEMVDIPLLKKIATTGKPVIMSIGMGTLEEIEEAVSTLRTSSCGPLILLKCTSAYPADPAAMNLQTMADMAVRFEVAVGLSDHTMGYAAAVAAVAMGARVIEKHFVLSRTQPGPDSAFSMEPQEFRAMVEAIRVVEKAVGRVSYEMSAQDLKMRSYRRSLFIAEDVEEGDLITTQNVRCVRPADGLHPRHLDEVLGKMIAKTAAKGTPLTWEHIR